VTRQTTGTRQAATRHIAAEVAGRPVLVSEVDDREALLRASPVAPALPAAGTNEGRQLRRWLTQLLVAERVVTIEAARRGVTAHDAPDVRTVLPDATARVEIGSVPAALLDSTPLARALFAAITAEVTVSPAAVTDYYARNCARFVKPPPPDRGGWRVFPAGTATRPRGEVRPLTEVRALIERELLGAARRQAFARWLDTARAELVRLRSGYEHPGDPRQPDNTHRH
jgi:[acyl-carrier-protein] S-malonyltransferase